MTVLPGQPATLSARAADLVRSAEVIAQVVEDLRGIVLDDRAKAIEAVHERSTAVADDLERAHGRYDGTARAITDYAVALADAHARAEAAQLDLEAARNDAAAASDDVTFWQGRVESAAEGADTTADEGSLSAASWRLRNATDAAGEAQARIEAARRDMEEAAETAMSRIENAIAETNEGFWDGVAGFFEDIGGFFAGMADWVGSFLQGVWDFLQRLASTVLAVLELVVILVAFVAFLATFGTAGLIVGLAIAAVLAGFIVWSIASDVAAPTPEVTPFDPSATGDDEFASDESGDLATVLRGTAEVDGLGGASESVIKLTKVLGPDGWYWTVTLPSTQEWLSRFGDQGAVNDLDSNLALMMTPALQTQYERAVLDAMAQAGVGPDDHVMLVGFSQGGIMAGHLAAYNSDYNWDAVVVSGAPIDHMPIPGAVDVVSVQHDWDPVPRLDYLTGGPLGAPLHGSNWTTIHDSAPGDPPAAQVTDIHNADQYATTLGDHVDEIRTAHPGLDTYFAGSGTPSRTQYYHWTE